MSCRRVDRLLGVSRELDAAQRRMVAEHLRGGCPRCRAAWRDERRVRSYFRELELVEPSAGLEARLLAIAGGPAGGPPSGGARPPAERPILRERPRSRWGGLRPVLRPQGFPAGLALLGFLLLGLTGLPPRPGDPLRDGRRVAEVPLELQPPAERAPAAPRPIGRAASSAGAWLRGGDPLVDSAAGAAQAMAGAPPSAGPAAALGEARAPESAPESAPADRPAAAGAALPAQARSPLPEQAGPRSMPEDPRAPQPGLDQAPASEPDPAPGGANAATPAPSCATVSVRVFADLAGTGPTGDCPGCDGQWTSADAELAAVSDLGLPAGFQIVLYQAVGGRVLDEILVDPKGAAVVNLSLGRYCGELPLVVQLTRLPQRWSACPTTGALARTILPGQDGLVLFPLTQACPLRSPTAEPPTLAPSQTPPAATPTPWPDPSPSSAPPEPSPTPDPGATPPGPEPGPIEPTPGQAPGSGETPPDSGGRGS